MKNLLAIFIFVFMIASYAFTQPSAYQKAMGRALGALGQAETTEDLQKAGNQFQRISTQMPNEWLPYYYQSLALTRMSFEEKERGDELADEAQRILDLAKPLVTEAKDKAEVKTLQGMIYTAKLVVDPMSRGQLYSAMSGKAYQEALQLDPTNPRARLMSIRSKMGAAQFFKQDLFPFIQQAKVLLDEWDNFTPTSKLHPNWGKKIAQSVAKADIKSEKSSKRTAKLAKSLENSSAQTTPPDSLLGFSIEATITGLRSNDGVILISLQNNQKEIVKRKKATIQNKQAVVQFDGLQPGTYALKYIHDENNDGKLNFGFMHIPSEGYGYANNARGSMGPPAFEKTTFPLQSNLKMTLSTMYH
ncbi:MAG TPA: DUF2141 domain-containing protein [Saprospiraceae bacterium]|nr:DUF2141 domain-containing protein [Saprospiraceae bacterium]